MRALEVVMIDEMADPLPGIAEVDEHRTLDALTPERAPETLDLAQRRRPTRRCHDLLHAALVQFLAESALAAPGDVLAAVVGQDFFRHAIRRQRGAQDFDH